MATQPQVTTQPLNPTEIHHVAKKPVPSLVVPTKIGFMGEQGTGKTTSAGLIAAGLSAQFYDRAPIHVTDPELGWQFLEPVIFQPEKISLVQRTVPTFAAMLKDIEKAEKAGACVYAVEIGKIWIEIVRTLQKADPVGWGMQLRSMWDDFIARFLNSPMHCIVIGRIQDVIEQVMTENGVQSIKTGEGMKAGGQRNNMGYEPHLVIRMYREQKNRVKKGKVLESEGRVIHRAEITKDRTWALNGKVFRWQDRDGYQAGDYRYVLKDFLPHFNAVQRTMKRVTLDTLSSSAEIIETDDNGRFYHERERKNAISAEISSCLDLSFGGRAKDDVQVRLAVCELIFGVKSKEARESLTLDQLERGLRILHVYEKYPVHQFDSKEAILKQIAEAIREYESGLAEMDELPF